MQKQCKRRLVTHLRPTPCNLAISQGVVPPARRGVIALVAVRGAGQHLQLLQTHQPTLSLRQHIRAHTKSSST
jgi:hypothetical protein